MTGSSRLAASAVSFVAAAFGCAAAHAGEKIELGGDAWVSVGGGLRASYRITEDGKPSPTGAFDDFTLESARIYLNGQATKVIGFTLNTEIEQDANGDPDNMRVLDGILRLEFNDYFNVWGGLLLPPNDRANLDGPYYLGTWDFPLVQAFPAEFAGRDYGVSIWGQTGGGQFKYAVGAFQGCSNGSSCDTGAADDGDFSYVGKLTYNFWDPEPGYYTSSDYYGKKEILALSGSATYQANATGTDVDPGDYFGFNIDALMQKKVFDGHVLTLEGAYYHYDTDGKPTPLAGGDGYFLLASFLVNQKIGPGMIQPVVRWEDFNRDDGASDATRVEGGFNYIIREHDTRISLLYSDTDFKDSGIGSIGQYILGVQLQY